ncbi:Glucan endo-1,3-beta-glucosidase precursor [Dorcoceras hygrometricum]|uniref:Glucan endo-1,3-beta-glucosidase n=1 Tax=Dorcoceras hygrometricum TaxID=472368 RepID=A0A2Z7BEM5_9LAMI|nr:Glucan endo-1,3-beta-glucosidase precursor [Dorcoceras hygrometricum]
MATFFWVLPFLLLTFSDSLVGVRGVGVGINYGQIANNLPSPSRVAYLLKSVNISRVKLYDADPNVLSAFANSDVEFVIGLGNEYLQQMTDPMQAQSWIQQRVQPYISRTKITCITVGNEVLTGNDTQLKSYLLPAMQTVNGALANLGLSKEIFVTTAHSFGILSNSFPPSAGAFRQDLAEYIQSILDFHAQTDSPFLINAYPFFAYKDNPEEVSLSYALFQPTLGRLILLRICITITCYMHRLTLFIQQSKHWAIRIYKLKFPRRDGHRKGIQTRSGRHQRMLGSITAICSDE